MPVTPSMDAATMEKWNKLIEFAKKKGYSGLSDLDHNDSLRQKVFKEYNASNPENKVDYSIVKNVQNEIENYKQKALQAIDNGKGAFDKGTNKSNFMSGISKVDGIFGSKTSSWQFPKSYMIDRASGEKKELGFANKSDMVNAMNSPK